VTPISMVHIDHQRIIAIIVAGGLLLVILELVRRKRLMERYALLWLFSTVILLVLAAWQGLMNTLASAVGIAYPPSALFAVAFGFVVVLLVHFSMAVSRLTDQNKVLAQRVGLLQQQLQEHHGQLAHPDQDEHQTAQAQGSAGPGEPPQREQLSRTG
jgi:hypothetical protein